MKNIIKYIESILEDSTLNEEDYIIALYKILENLKALNNE